jgi:glutathione S-transferase
MVQYLVSKYEGPLTPKTPESAALTAMYWGWAQDYYSFVLSPMHDIITGHNEVFWRNLRLTDTLAEGGQETGIANLAKLHTARLTYLENHLKSQETGPYLMGADCSYADIFLYTCVRTVQETAGFGMLRGVIGDTPFADFPIIASISEAVGKIEAVSATVGNKFAEAPI